MIQRVIFVGFLMVIFFGVQACAKKAPTTAGPEPSVSSPTSDASSQSSDSEGMVSEAQTSNLVTSFPVIHFEFNQFSISAEDRAPLKDVAETLKREPQIRLTIEGHCDERGSNEYNLALGERRARSVKDYLRTLGVSQDRLSTISYGEERPMISGSSEDSWAKNRRAEMISSKQ